MKKLLSGRHFRASIKSLHFSVKMFIKQYLIPSEIPEQAYDVYMHINCEYTYVIICDINIIYPTSCSIYIMVNK